MAPSTEWRPIGKVVSELRSLNQAPKQGAETGTEAVLAIDPAWQEGIFGLKPGRWLWVLCLFDQSSGAKIMVHPRGDRSRPQTGVFNTRSPHRPNPVSLSLVRLEAIDQGRLTVSGLEMVDGTPVLDIKPYVPGLDRPWKEG